MKVAVLGGGPAGLYFSLALKKLNSNAEITVFESRNESIHSYGLGYTLQTLGIDLLARLDPDFYAQMFKNEPYMTITQALFKTNDNSKTFDFTEGFSVTRSTLMQYLLGLAEQSRVKLVHKLFTQEFVNEVENEFDLVVGADGVNSQLRQRYAQQFGAQSYNSSLMYSWFTNETEQTRTEACFYAFEAPEGVLALTSYPLTHNKQVVVIEMTEECLNNGYFKGKTPEQCCEYLNSLFSQNGDVFSLKSADLPWYNFVMNTAANPVHHNTALIGDAAFAFHYSLGQGVSTAFTMGYLLANCLSKSEDIPTALQRYSKTIGMSLSSPVSTSLNSIKWLEHIDEHFKAGSKENHLDMFRLKHEYSLLKAQSERPAQTAV